MIYDTKILYSGILSNSSLCVLSGFVWVLVMLIITVLLMECILMEVEYPLLRAAITLQPQ